MEIKIGEFVRTDNGIIGRYVIHEGMDNIDIGKKLIGFDIENDITKHSFNIIDLIEEGDYVNGSEVVPILGYDKDGNDIDEVGILKLYDDNDVGLFYLAEVTIKSIVTKEQFKAREYEVK